MANTTHMMVASLALLVLLAVGTILLQIFLSRRESKWPGLVLPGITFLYALIMVLSVAVYDGRFPWGAILSVGVLGNLPTLVLLAVYWACREKLRKKSEIDKMHIDDL